MPAITLSQPLQAYLTRKKCTCVVIDLAECKTCGGAVAEVFARAAKPAEAARLKEKGCRTLPAGTCEVTLANPYLKVADEVSLGLRHFLGIADITVEGITF
ncbi:MAG: hypothetical protein Q4E12_03475 [Coriobacteriia bacterium]|nr:hypothetical protein [Coriobacteriia bacterium]